MSEVLSEELLEGDPSNDPSQIPTEDPFPHLPWLKNNGNVTVLILAVLSKAS